jgi:hypothetical protein
MLGRLANAVARDRKRYADWSNALLRQTRARNRAAVAAGSSEDNPACGDASTPLLEIRNVTGDRLMKPLNGLHPLKINLNRRFHGVVLSVCELCE